MKPGAIARRKVAASCWKKFKICTDRYLGWRTGVDNSVNGIIAIIPATGLFRHLPTNVRKSADRVSVGAWFGGIIRES
jgi:hypothetical protein